MALLEGGIEAAKQVNQAVEEVQKKHQINPDGTGNIDKMYLDELDRTRAEQAGRELFGTFGLDGATTEAYMRELAQKAAAPATDQIQIIQMVGQMAGEMGTTPQELFPIVLAIYIRNKDVQLTRGILSIIAKYESQAPGIGVLQAAEKAALGQPFGQEMLTIRLALMALSGEYGSKGLTTTKDLERAIYSIVAPQSKAGAEIMKAQEQRLRTQQSMEEWFRMLGRFQGVWMRERLKKVEDVYQQFVKNFPMLANSAPMNWWYRVLQGTALASTIKEYAWDPAVNPVMQGPSPMQKMTQLGNMPLDSALGRGASLNVDRIVLAQAQKPTDLRQNSAPQAQNAPAAAPQGVQIPNAEASAQAAQQAQQATNAKASGALPDILKNFLTNTELDNQLSRLITTFNNGQEIVDTELKTLKEIISKVGSTDFVGDSRVNSAVYMTPEQFIGQADRVYQLATQQKRILLAILDLLNQAVLAHSQANPVLGSLLQELISDWRANHAKVDSNIVTAFELGLVGPIEQQIAMLAPQKEYLKQGLEMAAMINNIGADQYAGPFSALCMQISQLRMEASRRYMQVASNPQVEPQMKNYCLLRARQQMQQALLARNEGTMAIMKMTQGIFGGQSLLPTAESEAWVKVGSQNSVSAEIEREADAELEEYWNELYKDSPGAEGYGTALEHALKYHNVPTDQVPASKPRMRRNTAESGSSS
jgi:hypothetical protein